MPVRSYPVSAIDDGVRACIENSRRLLSTANLLLENRKLEHSFIFYTYAEEEFGKALMLLENKKIALDKGEDMVRNDSVTFGEHDVKISKAEAHNKALGVRLIDDSTIPVINDISDLKVENFKFGGADDFKYEEKTYSSEERRLNFLYIDFNKHSQWQTPSFRPISLELSFTYDELRKELASLEQKIKINPPRNA